MQRKASVDNQNLEIALRYIRYEDTPRPVWIDAICIDQSNLEERAQQVRLMREIYQHSARTIAWLGEETEESSLSMSYKGPHGSGEILKAVDEGRQLDQEAYRCEYVAFHALLSSSWFTRAWILQEVAVSPHLSLQCGKKSMDWELFTKVFWFQAYTSVGPFGFPMEKALQPAGHFIFRDNVQTDEDHDWSQMLLAARTYDASDPRDKLFSLRGLLKGEEERSIRIPDYSITWQDVYVDFSKQLIQRSASLDILYHARLGDPSPADGLPSWVPDLTMPQLFSNFGDWSEIYCAAQDTWPRLSRSMPDANVLTLAGKIVDTVSQKARGFETMVSNPELEKEKPDTDPAWEAECQKIAQSCHSSITGESIDNAYYRTLMADKWFSHEKSTPDFREGCEGWIRAVRNPEDRERLPLFRDGAIAKEDQWKNRLRSMLVPFALESMGEISVPPRNGTSD